MSSFLKTKKSAKGGFQIKPKGAQSRIHDVLDRIEKQNNTSSSSQSANTPATGSVDVVAPSRQSCPNPRCPNPSAPVTDGFCSACGREVESTNIVAEVQFGETSSGAATVHGTFVGADQSTARGLGGNLRRMGGAAENRERTIREARGFMSGYATQLNINPNIVDVGVQIFKLAASENWIQGRGMDKVVPVCLYAACRRESRCEVMLIDFADIVKINVYELGHVFKGLDEIYNFQSNGVKSIIPEDLMHRFASKLDFGAFTNNVAESAVKLCRRMGRDWMVMGRRPSGICGACLLMAARMWNFRRTVREVVYVVKVTTATIENRLGEFKVTESSDLTIEDFLNHEFLESRHDPPSFYKNTPEWQEKQEKEKSQNPRKRKIIEDIDDDETQASREMPPPPVPRPAPDTSKMRQVSEFLPKAYDNAEGREFVVPFNPRRVPKAPPKLADRELVSEGLNAENPNADTAVDELAEAYGNDTQNAEDDMDESYPVHSRRRRKENQEPVPTFDDEWEKDEQELEQQISEVINDPNSDAHRSAIATAAFIAKVKAEWARSLLPEREPKMDEVIDDDEFDDDPEVQFCKLSPEEAEIKATIWMNANKDWLRREQEKMYRKQMAELGPPKRRRNRVKRPRIGEGQLTPASTPGEAAIEAMKKRGFSKRINYDAISNLFSDSKNKQRGPGSVISSAADSGSRAGSVFGDQPSSSTAPRPGQQPEPEEEPEEEVEVQVDQSMIYDDGQELEHPGYDEDNYDEEAYDEGGDEGGDDYW